VDRNLVGWQPCSSTAAKSCLTLSSATSTRAHVEELEAFTRRLQDYVRRSAALFVLAADFNVTLTKQDRWNKPSHLRRRPGLGRG
jgi:hypothetical protein